MNKDLINRILNAVELICYCTALLFYSFDYFHYRHDDEQLTALLGFVLVVRICLNYVVQIKLSNVVIISIFRKIFKK